MNPAKPFPVYVQAIATMPGGHYDTIRAVAIASGLAFVRADLTQPQWSTWLAGSFTKSVRRVSKSSQVRRLDALDPPAATASCGEATAWAFDPMTYEQMPKAIRSLQSITASSGTREGSALMGTSLAEGICERPVLLLISRWLEPSRAVIPGPDGVDIVN